MKAWSSFEWRPSATASAWRCASRVKSGECTSGTQIPEPVPLDMRVKELWRYPVKSMAGERLTSCEVLATGLDGDRRWGLVDLATGHVLTARREPRLLFAQARCPSAEEVEIILPDGRRADDDDALSEWLARPVALRRAGATGGVYQNPRDFESETDWVTWQGPPAAWHDAERARVSLVSTATIGGWSPRRFRPNVLLAGHGEDELVGRTISLGSAGLDVTEPIGRCVMVTRPQPGLDADLDVLRTINRERNAVLAVGAVVRIPGAVAEGDAVVEKL